jgi:uncharacterized protein YxeA
MKNILIRILSVIVTMFTSFFTGKKIGKNNINNENNIILRKRLVKINRKRNKIRKENR